MRRRSAQEIFPFLSCFFVLLGKSFYVNDR